MAKNIETSGQINTRTGIVISAGTIITTDINRRTIIIQNLGTVPLFVKFGENASTSDFDFILNAGMVNDDGTGGIFAEDTLSYVGIISVAGVSVRCTATSF